MKLETLSMPWYILRGTNCTDSAIPSRVSRLGPPSGLGTNAAQATSSAIIGGGVGGDSCQNGLLVVPYGVGADDGTFSLRVQAWRPVLSRQPTADQVIEASQQWVAVTLCEVACTLSDQQTGTAGGLILATSYFCKTLSVTYGNTNVSVEIISTADGLAASFLVDLKGAKLVEVTGGTGGSATSFNALYSHI